MSLRFIYGRAGKGKSTYCIDEIKKRVNGNKKEKLILLVPEQLSFQSEKKVIEAIGGVGLNNVYVLTFKRMAYWVFKECGGVVKKHIDKCGKSMILYSVLEEVEDELRVFSKAAAHSGFVDKLLTIISEFKRYNVTPDGLNDIKIKVGENTLLYNKINDLENIFSKFDSKLHEGYIDSDDDLKLMAEKLGDCHIFDESLIWIDEFSGFTPQQYDIIEELLNRAKEVNITLNMDINVREKEMAEVLSPIILTEERIIKICENNGISLKEPIDLSENNKKRFESQELQYLEENYFKYPFYPYKKEVKDISIFKGLNPYSEVENLSGEILKLVRERGARFNEIAVVSRKLDSYENIIKSIFSENNVPFFIDKKKEASSNPIVILLLSSMEIYNRKWNYESVFRFLKCGLLGWEQEGIDLLENYILMSGIKGKKKWNDDSIWYNRLIDVFNLKKEFNKYYDVSIEGEEIEEIDENRLIEIIRDGEIPEKHKVELNLDQEDIDILGDLPVENRDEEKNFKEIVQRVNKLDNIRRLLIQHITPFHDSIKGNRMCEDIAVGLFSFMDKLGLYDIISELIQGFENRGESELSSEYGHIWNVIIDVMDQMVEGFKGSKMTIDKFTDILKMGLQQHKMGFIPNTLDQVMVSSIERIKSHETKYLFILGVNDGVFPSGEFEEGILSDFDRIALREEGIEVAKDTKSKAFEEQYLIYTTLSIPSKVLRVSYPVGNSEGKTLRASMIISRMKSIFPKIKEDTNIITKRIDELIPSKTAAFNNLILSIRKGEVEGEIHEFWREVYKWFQQNNGYGERIESLITFFDYENQVGSLNEDSVKNLYSKDNLFSVSKLEKYNECPFSYFIRYGLKAKDRKIFELSAPDLGSFMHTVIDRFSKEVESEKRQWNELEDSWCKDKISNIIEAGMEEPIGRIFKASPKYEYFGGRIKRVLNKSVWVVIQHMKRSEFLPYGYEMEFGGRDYSPIEITLDNGTKVKLIGKIDRVDRLIMDSEEYFRIIDYKSGNKSLKLSQVYYGLQLQLVTYLDAMLKREEIRESLPVFPAGIFYLKIDDPIIKTNGKINIDKLQDEILKKLKMKGIVLKDSQIVTKMDDDIQGLSLIIPAGLKKDGSLREGTGTNMASLEEFELLREHVRSKLKETCSNILSGNIDIMPYKTSTGDTPCTYCDYSHVCAFDPLLKENNYRIINDIKDNVIWDILNKDDKAEKEEDKDKDKEMTQEEEK
ncbi:PD-(D/E)XK nuclease family protein [Oceanirhabdus seepicola]|uniref:ATP-dependent helicase/deoxyribonuclease subunit B n=1 Tax=Oceanirhabdus seepicola TaxID=2828781 RepID=A0A9J6NW41_9CLOT|nr:PD-(D/E)XK nuclease family protein [Oceanirhabdus seepicola]MCM1988483.1 exodeoxyribonuclease V subunit gamma [Oceanirhabdus seepicola]